MLTVAKAAVPLTLPLLATLCGIGGVFSLGGKTYEEADDDALLYRER